MIFNGMPWLSFAIASVFGTAFGPRIDTWDTTSAKSSETRFISDSAKTQRA